VSSQAEKPLERTAQGASLVPELGVSAPPNSRQLVRSAHGAYALRHDLRPSSLFDPDLGQLAAGRRTRPREAAFHVRAEDRPVVDCGHAPCPARSLDSAGFDRRGKVKLSLVATSTWNSLAYGSLGGSCSRLCLPVGRAGVEGDHVDLEVEQGSDGGRRFLQAFGPPNAKSTYFVRKSGASALTLRLERSRSTPTGWRPTVGSLIPLPTATHGPQGPRRVG